MGKQKDFIIHSGILVSYHGPGGEVVIPDRVWAIEKDVFSGREDLTSVVLPKNCHYQASCFAGCTSLTELSFLSRDFFDFLHIAVEDLPSLTTVRLPENWGSCYINIANCPNLKQFIVDPDNPHCTVENGILYSKDKKTLYAYPSARGRVVIPSGVEYIGGAAFCKNTELTHLVIPETVKAITGISLPSDYREDRYYDGTSPFSGCANLTEFEVSDGNESFSSNGPMLFDQNGKRLISWPSASGKITFSEEVQTIRRCAFEKNTEITEVVIPRNITEIDTAAFRQCTALSRVEVLSPNVRFGSSAFNDCSRLRHAELPDCLSSLPDFQNCTSLEEFTVPSKVSTIDLRALYGCTSLKTVWIPETTKELRDPSEDAFNNTGFALKPNLLRSSKKLPAGLTPLLQRCGDGQDVAFLLLNQTASAWETAVNEYLDKRPELVTDTIRALTTLLSGKKKLNAAAKQRIEDFLLKRQENADAETLRTFYQSCGELFQKTAAGEESLSPLERLVHADRKLAPLLRQLQSRVKKGIPSADGQTISPPEKVVFVIASYIDFKITWGKNGMAVLALPEEAEEAAGSLDRGELTALLEELLYEEPGIPKKILIPALCRFGSEEQVQRLILQKKKWHNWGIYKATGRKNEALVDQSLYLSDTKAAMRSCNLDLYAETRGTDAETLRDTVLSVLDLDENGKKRYDLGGRLVEASLTTDMKISLYDVTAAKAVKSLPKKDADPALYEEAKKKLSALKKEVKKLYTERKSLLLQDFLSGDGKNAETWKKLCQSNLLLRQLFGLLVWEQSGITFTLKDGCAVNASGQPFDIGSEEIRLAHPMEMKPEDLKAWQTYFVSNGCKQPFAQIWEPVYLPRDVKPDRYQGCVIPLDQFRSQEKHGISFAFDNADSSLSLRFEDCIVSYTLSEYPRHFLVPGIEVTITDFRFREYNRQVNHIVGRLDGWTISQRIEKDDVSVVAMLQGATLAQVTKYLNLAMEHSCANCTAALLEYKANHFADFDPVEEFTLD